MRKSIFIIAVFLMILLNSGCLKEKTGLERVMSVKQFVNLIDNPTQETNNATKHIYWNLTQVDSGDTILVKDKINYLAYDSANYTTRIQFVSDTNYSLPFSGDLRIKFAAGDNVEIKLHVFRDVFADPGNSSWTVSVKTIKEMWDTSTHWFTANSVIPGDTIRKV